MRKLLVLALLVCVPFLAPVTQGQNRLPNPPDYPLRCRGAAGMARADGRQLMVVFRKGGRAANGGSDGLEAGQCSWDDRVLSPNEPNRIVYQCESPGEATITARHINSGDVWTFWVYNDRGAFFRARSGYPGTPKGRPERL